MRGVYETQRTQRTTYDLQLPNLSQISFADVRTEMVKPKKGPKSWPAGMLVINNPGTEVSK